MNEITLAIRPTYKYWHTTDGRGFSDDIIEGDVITYDDLEQLAWDEDIEVTSDPELLDTLTTYFTGMHKHESVERLRAKLRLLDVGVYATAQIAAREELRDQ